MLYEIAHQEKYVPPKNMDGATIIGKIWPFVVQLVSDNCTELFCHFFFSFGWDVVYFFFYYRN
jgi:hypothetical protein